MRRHETIFRREDAILVVVDYQQRLVDIMPNGPEVTQEIIRLVKGMKILEVPVIATEQYRKGLGPTVQGVAELLNMEEVEEKLTFSCCGIDPFIKLIGHHHRRQAVLVGIEAHVCVLQTRADLLANGYQVHIPYVPPAHAGCQRDNALEHETGGGLSPIRNRYC